MQEIFYQVFDKGMLQDDKGNEVNFKNTIILLTSNVGTDTIMKLCADPDTLPDAAGLAEVLRPDLLKAFKPALLGRMTIVPYFPLGDEVMRKIIQLAAEADRRPGEDELQGDVHLRRRGGRDDRRPLQGGRERRAQRGPHPDRDAAAGDVARVPGADGGGQDGVEGARRAGGRWAVFVYGGVERTALR